MTRMGRWMAVKVLLPFLLENWNKARSTVHDRE